MIRVARLSILARGGETQESPATKILLEKWPCWPMSKKSLILLAMAMIFFPPSAFSLSTLGFPLRIACMADCR